MLTFPSLQVITTCKVEEQLGAKEEVCSTIPTNTSEIVEAFPRKITFNDFPAAEGFRGLGKKSSNFAKMNVITLILVVMSQQVYPKWSKM